MHQPRAREPWYVTALQAIAWTESGPVAVYTLSVLMSTVTGRFGPQGALVPVLAVVGLGTTAVIVMAAVGAGRRRPWAAWALLAGQLGLFLICAMVFTSAARRDSGFTALVFALGAVVAVGVGVVAVLALNNRVPRT
ncbi:hypothetical protein [Phytomonospora endophytica]|uniref:Uncharacterized protein n=1 Tax=Phytomonospora endophytica TaxID=714109 RepID=A0A841FUM3_9ACTN|nr:hypothetical protein [Phytomonospora endophytica]MBB6037047.1 hypothetical protein [Phytomonospora endophytica]GIG69409.1 hypothetical protein Pen01_57040 [Phytomonospora endophytica]